MNETNKITRKCIISNEILPINELIRFDFKKNENLVQLDYQKKLNGRGAYFYPTKSNWELIVRNKALNRAFRTKVSRETYDKINKQLEELECLK